MNDKAAPVFLFSLPRSGSTLLQRMLAGHSEIATQSEYWFLLPHIAALTGDHTYAAYSAMSLRNATAALLVQLPSGKSDYQGAIRRLGEHLYSTLATTGERYVVDKTPRYYLIIEEISQIFPDSKIIFLFRNPLAVAASLISSFNRGRLGTVRHRIDLYEGPTLLAEGFRSASSRALAIQYESLVADPEAQLREICAYLEIPYQEQMLSFSEVPVVGMGDMFGSKERQAVTTAGIDRWKKTFATPYRRRFLRKYLDYIGAETVETMGYDFKGLQDEIDNLAVRFDLGIRDALSEAYGFLMSALEIPLIARQRRLRKSRKSKGYIHF